MIISGGQPYYGQFMGVLLLDAQYPRMVGDVGHAATYRMPVQFDIVPGLTADRLIHHYDSHIVDKVRATIERLHQRGARAIVGGCGFFAAVHREIRDTTPVPFLSSSLLQVPWLRMLYGDPIGILTIDAEALNDHYLKDCGFSRDDPGVVVQGIDPASMFSRVYFENRDHFDPNVMRDNVVEAARALINTAPNVRAVVLECTNMAPFARSVQDVVRVPIYDIQGLAHFVAEATERANYA